MPTTPPRSSATAAPHPSRSTTCASTSRPPGRARPCHTHGSTIEDGERRPIKDLVAPGRFLLIAGEQGDAWCDAAGELAGAHSLPIDTVRIGHVDGDLFDPRCTWLRHRGIGPDGAILVRPDRFVAWRSVGSAEDPEGELARALTQILARPIGVQEPSAAK